MRKPLSPSAPIDAKRFKQWIDRFGSYRAGVINVIIDSWLNQFETEDRDLAARVLDVVEYYSQSQIAAAYRDSLALLPGWSIDPSRRTGNWRFCPMSRSAGESGDAMLHSFRIANRLTGAPHNKLFVGLSDLFRMPLLPVGDPDHLGGNDTVVFLDDFSGTGDQVCKTWNDPVTSYGALLAGVGTVYLLVVAASVKAVKRVKAKTKIQVVPGNRLVEEDNIFADECPHFTAADRKRLTHYGKIADPRRPKGFGSCGYVVVFQHRTPNNSIPILHADHDEWTGLFPRH